MALQTNLDLRNQVIYQIYPRQYSIEGTFKAVEKDLDRIHALGVDFVYFLPIHPIGFEGRKGVDGCPYSISDYYGVAEELGTLEDFESFVHNAHKKGLKVMIDIVFNHTSRDSKILKEHPEWFYFNEQGKPANRVGEWSDVTDLTYQTKEQWQYMIDNLVYWAKRVDGFRCDVAPMVPLQFWLEARAAVENVSPGHTWLTESVHPELIHYIRSLGYDCHSDGEMYQAFDICYDYDIDSLYEGYLRGNNTLEAYLKAVLNQDYIYPKNYIKLRAFENHDKARLRDRCQSDDMFYNMLALSFFLKGTPMLYNGVEVMSTKQLTLFDKDPIDWEEHEDITPFIQTLVSLKKDSILRDGNFHMHFMSGGAVMSYTLGEKSIIGLFNVEGVTLKDIPLEDGTYHNALDGKMITIKNKQYTGIHPVWIIN